MSATSTRSIGASREWVEVEQRHASGFVPSRELAIVEGRGSTLRDAEGRDYLDLASGHGVANVGHAHPLVAHAIHEQAARLIISSAAYPNDQRARLYRRLADVLPEGLERMFFCNSGTEAVEAALKIARVSTGRTGIVALMRGFHGRTLGALSTTWERRYRAPFEPLLPDVRHVSATRIAALDEALDDSTAGLILEVVQGEGGVHPLRADYLHRASELCRERGALLIVDEIQTGFGRTGRFFASEHADLVPDVLCLGKAIAGGIPMGAVAFRDDLGPLSPGIHGSTFGGNPLACAAALATLDVIEEEHLVERAERLGRFALETIHSADLPPVRSVRGLGLMLGLELKTRVRPYLDELQERGVLALPAGASVLRLLPPLTISQGDFERGLAAVLDVLSTALPVEAKPR